MTAPNLLEVRQLSIRFRTDRRLRGCREECLLFSQGGRRLPSSGESGSGKSVTALSLTRLLPEPPAEIVQRRHHLPWRSTFFEMDLKRLRAIRGGGIAYIFQEPSTSLNPVYSIRSQIAEAIRLHRPEVEGRGC